MTPADLDAQRRSFAYGNAAVDHPEVTREMIDEVAERLDRDRKARGHAWVTQERNRKP